MIAFPARTLLAGAVGALSASAAAAGAPAYDTIELQARSNLIVNDNGWNVPPGTSFNSISPAINDAQQVAFSAGVVPIGGDLAHSGAGIWLGGHATGAFVVIHDPGTDPKAFVGISDPSLNANGDVAYYTFGDTPNYVLWRYDTLAGDSDTVSTLPLTASAFSNPVMLADGRIGFRATVPGGAAVGITVATGGATAYAYDSGVDAGSPYAYLYTPDTSEDGRIFVKASVGDYDHNEILAFDALYEGTRVAANRAIDPQSSFSTFNNGLGVSRDGRFVALIATLADDGVQAVYRFQDDGAGGYTAVEIARIGSAPITELPYFSPAVNDAGVVAFRAKDAAGDAIYAGDGTNLVRVIGNGDAVLTDMGPAQIGQHDSSPAFAGKPAINNRGDIAFVAGVYPEGDNQTEWGSGVFVAYADAEVADRIFADGFETQAEAP